MALQRQAYQDNLDVTLKIDGQQWLPIQLKIELSVGKTPDYVDMIIMPSPNIQDELPNDPTLTEDEGGLLGTSFEISVDNELVVGDRVDEELTIFSGNLANLSTAAEGAFEGVAYDPSQQVFSEQQKGRSFFNTELYIPGSTGANSASVDVPDYARVDGFGAKSDAQASSTRIKASDLMEEIMKKAGITDYEIHLRQNGWDVNGTAAGRDLPLYFSDDYVPIGELLNKIELRTNSSWWFDRQGTFHFGAVRPDGQPVDAYELQFITDTTAGLQTPPYQSVQVIGSGVVSEDGWSRQALNEENALVLQGNIRDEELQSGQLVEPTFTYRNMSITTQAEADAARNRILEKLREQQAKGKVTVVGMPEVRPLDTIQMPNSDVQPMGGKRYGVTKVVHKLNSSDGYVTDIHVGGLVNGQKAMYENEIDEQARKLYTNNIPDDIQRMN